MFSKQISHLRQKCYHKPTVTTTTLPKLNNFTAPSFVDCAQYSFTGDSEQQLAEQRQESFIYFDYGTSINDVSLNFGFLDPLLLSLTKFYYSPPSPSEEMSFIDVSLQVDISALNHLYDSQNIGIFSNKTNNVSLQAFFNDFG